MVVLGPVEPFLLLPLLSLIFSFEQVLEGWVFAGLAFVGLAFAEGKMLCRPEINQRDFDCNSLAFLLVVCNLGKFLSLFFYFVQALEGWTFVGVAFAEGKMLCWVEIVQWDFD